MPVTTEQRTAHPLDPDCECQPCWDKRMAKHRTRYPHGVPINHGIHEVMFGRLGIRRTGGCIPWTGESVADAAGEMLRTYDESRTWLNEGVTFEAVFEAAADFEQAHAGNEIQAVRNPKLADARRRLLASGLSQEAAARLVNLPLATFLDCDVSAERTKAERLLRAGAESYRQVADETGLAEDTVRKLARRLGVQSAAAKLGVGGRGGNRTNAADTLARLIELTLDKGLKVAEARLRVQAWLRHEGRPAEAEALQYHAAYVAVGREKKRRAKALAALQGVAA